MANYDYREYATKTWVERYPSGLIGITEWREQRLGPNWQGFGPVAMRLSAPARGALSRPKIFVSHRQTDVDKAARIAWLADQEGFEFWLDALDPSLGQLQALIGTASPQQLALATAAIIEMALLNSTHVIATMTMNTKGSQWVPYEYGRAKEAKPITVQAGCWVDRTLSLGSLPEYLHLGKKTFSETDIRGWLGSEFTDWRRNYGSPATAPAGNWRGTVPAPL